MENFRPGVADRLGVGYDAVREVRPDIVYASISGFGQYGPYADRPGYDLIAQGMAGAVSVTGDPGGPPVKCGLPVGDLGAGMLCAIGILGAYTHRLRTGEGQYLETSLYEAVLAMSVWESTELFSTGRAPERLGSAHRMSAPYQVIRTADGLHDRRRQQRASVAAPVRRARAGASGRQTRGSPPTRPVWSTGRS